MAPEIDHPERLSLGFMTLLRNWLGADAALTQAPGGDCC
jgi:hypothetical protein